MTQILWTKPVCQLDENGIFIGMAEADLDVYARDGSYLMPAGCIDTEPPAPRQGYAAKWVNAEWQYLPDLRGQTAYNTETGEDITINEIGELPEYLTLLPRPDDCHDWVDGKWKLNKDKAAEQAAQQLQTAKDAKLAEINATAQAFVEQTARLAEYPQFEQSTWLEQQRESFAWEQNPEAETPMLAIIAAKRGIDLDKLRTAALRKAKEFSALSAAVAGQRQHYADLLAKAKDVAAVDAIVPTYQV